MYVTVEIKMLRLEPNRVLTDVTPCIRVVVAEPIVIQSRLRILVLPLILKGYERGWPFPLPPVDVQLLLPNLVALLVVGLHGRAEIVGDDGETLAVGDELGSRHERVLVSSIYSCCERYCREVVIVIVFYNHLPISKLL